MRTTAERFDERLAICMPAAARVEALVDMPPGPTLVAELYALRATPMTGNTAVRVTALWERVKAWCEAESMISAASALEWFDTLPGSDALYALDVAGNEVGAACNVSPTTGTSRVALADQVNQHLPESWEALDRGEWSLSHLKAFARVVRHADAAVVSRLEAVIVPAAVAGCWTPHLVEVETAKALITVDPDGAAARAKRARKVDDVEFFAGHDETGHLFARGEAMSMRQVMDAIEQRAVQLGRDGDDRPIGQRRITAMHQLITGTAQAAPAEIVVTIDLPTALGLADHAAQLSGFGPITAEAARTLFDDAAFRRMVTDPLTGDLLDLGRTRYRPGEPLLRFIRHRDQHCQFPGCQREATWCDCDHIDNYPHGPTNRVNLHLLCRRHHNLKTRRAWTVVVNPDGSETWTSAYGLHHTRHRGSLIVDPIEPPPDDHLPEDADDATLDADPDPPRADDPLPEPPTITLEEFFQFSDDLDRAAIIGANKWFDAFYQSQREQRFDAA